LCFDSFMQAMLRLLGVLVLTTGAWAQMGAIGGVVKYSNGAIAKGVVVQVEREDVRGEQKSAKTDKNGRYLISGLPIGVYRLILTLGARVVDSADHVQTHPGATTPINFVIKIS